MKTLRPNIAPQLRRPIVRPGNRTLRRRRYPLDSLGLSHFQASNAPQPSIFEGPDRRPGTASASDYVRRIISDRTRYLLWYLHDEAQPFRPHSHDYTADSYSSKMLNWVQLLTTPTADTPGDSLVLHFDDKRYVFGKMAEGTQRAAVQRKMSINKIEDIFITGVVSWNTAGGLIGTILTIADAVSSTYTALVAENESRKQKGRTTQDVEKQTLTICAGRNINYLLATARRFVFRQGMPLKVREIAEDPRLKTPISAKPDWQDRNINVWYMPVPSNRMRKRSHEEYSAPDSGELTKEQVEATNRKVLETVVDRMFNSDWSIDALVETTLHQAKLPAKLFVRDRDGHIKRYEGPMPGRGQDVPDVPVLVRKPWPASTALDELPPTTPSTQSMCYIVKGHARRGKFNPQVPLKHGVAKQDFKKLVSGQSVTGADGTLVTPEMVLDEDVPGKGFVVVDLPDESYVLPCVQRNEWANKELMSGIHVVFWLLGPGVSASPHLRAFMEKTASSYKHVVSSNDTCPNMIALESFAGQSYKLHIIDPDRFPLPSFSNEMPDPVTAGDSAIFETARTGKMIQFAPKLLHQDEKIVPFPDIQNIAADDMGSGLRDDVARLRAKATAKNADPQFLARVEKVEADIPNRDTEIIALGTGSAMPSKYRNVSGTLVRVPGYGNYLFDCGENTLGQMARIFGNELPGVLRDLKSIWISHQHADHHLGLASVIKAWAEETANHPQTSGARLVVAGERQTIGWVPEYAQMESIGAERVDLVMFRAPGRDAPNRICLPQVFSKEETQRHGLAQIDGCMVKHCFGAMATVFTWPSGLKIAYSGDCRPSKDFAKMGRGATLLIHESTFDDALRGDAVAKQHSTMSEAIGVGREMGARRILLTHFSQRYQKVQMFEEDLALADEREHNAAGYYDKVAMDLIVLVAFDHMHVKLGDFRKAQAFLPAVQKLFEEVEDEKV